MLRAVSSQCDSRLPSSPRAKSSPHPRTQLGRQMLFHPAQVCSGAVTVKELNGLEEVSASCMGRVSGHRTSTEFAGCQGLRDPSLTLTVQTFTLLVSFLCLL